MCLKEKTYIVGERLERKEGTQEAESEGLKTERTSQGGSKGGWKASYGIAHVPARWMQETEGGDDASEGFVSMSTLHSRKRKVDVLKRLKEVVRADLKPYGTSSNSNGFLRLRVCVCCAALSRRSQPSLVSSSYGVQFF